VREIRMLRAMWRALETGLRNLLTGHEGGNAGHRQGVSFESPRQCSTLPGMDLRHFEICRSSWGGRGTIYESNTC
jgi:hypothetical protein